MRSCLGAYAEAGDEAEMLFFPLSLPIPSRYSWWWGGQLLGLSHLIRDQMALERKISGRQLQWQCAALVT